MTLILAGAGYARGMMSEEVRRIVSEASKVYVDTYTMPGSGWLVEEASALAPGRVVAATRSQLEEGSRNLVEEARGPEAVVVLVAGDPLVATTHVSLLVEARKAGVDFKYYPGVSGVCSAKAASTLHYYRFGRTVTIPGPWRNVRPYSVVEAVYANLCIGLHTALLLDVDDEGRQLSPAQALKIVLEVEGEVSGELGLQGFIGKLPVLVVEAGAGGEHMVRFLGTVSEASEKPSIAGGPSTLIIPAKLHPTEQWALEGVWGISFPEEVDSVYRDAVRACEALEFTPLGARLAHL